MADTGATPAYQMDFMNRLLHPEPLISLHTPLPSGEIKISIHDAVDKPPRQHALRGIYPFMTLQDIKHAVHIALDMSDDSLPDYMFIGIPTPIGKRLKPLDYGWSEPSHPTEGFSLSNPFDAVTKKTHDARFVDSTGARKNLGFHPRARMLLESSILSKKDTVTLHVFLYKTIEAIIPGERPLGENDWNGYLYPYFPKLSVENHTPTKEYREHVERSTRAFIRKREFYGILEKTLSRDAMFSLVLTGIRALRLHYTKPQAIAGIETIFYNTPVNSIRPYMRLLPIEGGPISKLHMVGEKPDIEDPRLLLQWGQERTITPDRDSAFVKILIRKRSGAISPLYCTLRLLDDGTADVTLEPPKNVRKLDPRSELDNFPQILQSAMEGFPYIKEPPAFINGMFIFGLNLKDVPTSYTTTALRAKLPVFSSIFQEIPPIPGETPLLMLRYKLINNFTNEDRIQSFITQVMSRKFIQGDTNYNDLIELVADEFDIEISEARKYVADKLKGQGDVVITGDDMMYTLQSNTGVDIGIFAQHPFYSFHVYRVDSQFTLQRIMSFLSILFSCSASELSVSKTAVREIVKEAEAEAEAAPEDNNFKSVEEEETNFKSVEDTGEAPEVKEDAEYFDDLMFDVSEQPTLEDEFGPNAKNVAEEGNARPEGVLSRIEEEPLEETSLPTSASLKKQIASDVERPSATQGVEPSKKFTFSKKTIETPVSSLSGKGFETYFSDKLKEADLMLFDFHRTHQSLAKYVTQCASNLMRQPAVMSEEQFNQMVKEYEDVLKSKEIKFIVFPLSKDAKKEPYDQTIKEYYTFMLYGTSDKVKNYYVCCKYFCTRDGILVRETELNGTTLRRPVKNADGSQRKEKEPGTCPFCEGKVIKNRRFPGVNETIIERGVKAGTVDSRHLYIRFLKKTNHPKGFYLPCCFLEDQPIRVGNPAYNEETSVRAVQPFEDDIDDSVEEDESASTTLTQGKVKIITYETTMIGAWKEYIVGSEKLPLEGIVKRYKKVREDVAEQGKLSEPQIGLLPPQLNPYFSQDSVDLVSRTFNPQKLKAGVQGFLRIGVENTSRYSNDSFLAAVAPFFQQNSVNAIKRLLSDPIVVSPSVFVGLNYGNLLLEMYKPNGKRPEITDEIKLWAKDNLHIKKVTTNNEELVMRAYMSYANYIEWLESDGTKKEYRHFANLFLQPEIFELATMRVGGTDAPVTEKARGIVFIILDMLKNGEVKVRCPPYPIHKDVLAQSDIGFLFHHYSGIWEPIFYADNKTPSERKLHSYALRFLSTRNETWPKIVQERVKEFIEQCKSSTGGKGFYTSFSGITSKKCIGITALIQELSVHKTISYYGLIRDAYNHVAAVIYKSESNTLIAIPVIDDGLSPSTPDGTLVLDWDDFTPAPLDQVLAFYKKYIYVRNSAQYTIQRQIKSKGSGRLEAVQLKNGLYVPISPPPEGVYVELPESVIGEVTEMEWSINRKIIMDVADAEPPGDEARIEIKEFNEVYEHLRMTFSNWLHTQEDGGELRNVLETTIYRNDIPLFEKRKRLEILLGSTIESWISESDQDSKRQASLLRVDCLLRPESECSGRCSWIQGDKCLIHAPTKSPYSDKASATYVLLLRLIEELLRFGERRKQLFEQRVQQLADIDEPIRDGNQYIIPEKSAVWTQLLRMEWSLEHTDTPLYLEEMATLVPTNPITEDLTRISEELKSIIGDDSGLYLYPSATKTLEPFLSFLNTSAVELGLVANASELTEPALSALLRKTSMPIMQIDLRKEPPAIIVKQPQRDSSLGYPVFVLRDDYPVSLLVKNPEDPKILEVANLPESLRVIIKESPKLFIKVTKPVEPFT